MAAKKTKKTAKKTATKKTATKRTMKTRKPNAAFMKPLTPSTTLATVVGVSPLPRTEVTKKLWAYIKKNGLQDQNEKRYIKADDKLKAVFGGRDRVSMFEMTKLVSKHLS
jgi:upstream activation factor subunit UAF30